MMTVEWSKTLNPNETVAKCVLERKSVRIWGGLTCFANRVLQVLLGVLHCLYRLRYPLNPKPETLNPNFEFRVKTLTKP